MARPRIEQSPVTFQRARLRRIKDTVHGPVCPVTARYLSLPWHWAETCPTATSRQAWPATASRACKVCKPFASGPYRTTEDDQ